jgi:hypothetical protein
VVNGIAFRRFSAQPAVTIVDIYGSNIDYIYRHMRPSELTLNGISPLKPTPVKRGCTLAHADRFNRLVHTRTNLVDNALYYEATEVHLHFEIRVPTRAGFQNVSPYWTIVQSHRFLTTGVDSSRPTDQPCSTEH